MPFFISQKRQISLKILDFAILKIFSLKYDYKKTYIATFYRIFMLYSSQFVAKSVQSLSEINEACVVEVQNIVTYLLIHVNNMNITYSQKLWWKFALIYDKKNIKKLFCSSKCDVL